MSSRRSVSLISSALRISSRWYSPLTVRRTRFVRRRGGTGLFPSISAEDFLERTSLRRSDSGGSSLIKPFLKKIQGSFCPLAFLPLAVLFEHKSVLSFFKQPYAAVITASHPVQRVSFPLNLLRKIGQYRYSLAPVNKRMCGR